MHNDKDLCAAIEYAIVSWGGEEPTRIGPDLPEFRKLFEIIENRCDAARKAGYDQGYVDGANDQ